jgi:hypothetical protein
MKSWKKPTLEQVDKAVALFAHGEQHRYFFDRLENPEWLTPLKEKGFFSSPPTPIRDEARGTIAFPAWPESRYLVRMAALAPEIVAKILFEIPETENSRVRDDIAEALLALPAELAAKIVSKTIGWTKSRFQLLLPERLGALVSHLASNGEVEPAIQLAEALLTVRADPRVSKNTPEENEFFRPKALPYFEPWHYQKILEKNIPDLVAVAADQTLTLLCDFLDDAVRFSQTPDKDQEPDDYSYIWRSAIDRPQHTVDDVRGLLVSAVLQAAEQNARNNPVNVPKIVRYLERRKWRVFHRIALHVLRLFANVAPDLVSERLKEPERFDRPDFHREYNLLAEACFGRLEADDQRKIFDWIQKGPDIQRFKTGWERFYGNPPTDEQVTRYSMAWQRDRLAPLVSELPQDIWSQRYAELVEALGPPSDAEHVAGATWVGLASPKSAEELGELTTEQLVNYLRSWVPSGHPMEASVSGLGQQLGSLVTSEPERFSAEAEKFEGLDPTYVRALLQALAEPAKQKRLLNWQKVLSLCRWVVDQPRGSSPQKAILGERDPDWSWTRKAIANLLARGFESDAIPTGARNEAWYVLECLTNDPEPTPEDELRHSENFDAASLSINTTRGEAMHAVVGYALWVRRRIENEPGSNVGTALGFNGMPEVRAVLDKHLDPESDPSLAIRAVYGQWFPWLHFLDREWAQESVPRIFPRDEALRDLRNAAWTTYIIYCQPFDEVFGVLEEEYRHAIDRIGTAQESSANLDAPDSRLAQHLITEYWRGELNAEDQDGLLGAFYAIADVKLRSLVIDFAGRSLHNTSGAVPLDALERLKNFWTRRFEAVRATETIGEQVEELTSFGWWFVSKKFPDQWSVDQLFEVLKITKRIEPEHLVLERLAELSASLPTRTIECLALIVEGDREGWAILGWRGHVRTIIATAINSADETARRHAVALVHHLGTRGNFEFRDLLPPDVTS